RHITWYPVHPGRTGPPSRIAENGFARHARLGNASGAARAWSSWKPASSATDATQPFGSSGVSASGPPRGANACRDTVLADHGVAPTRPQRGRFGNSRFPGEGFVQNRRQALSRRLNVRHIRFIALGSAIGTGLFYGSSETIDQAGPAVLLAYLLGGLAVFFVLRSLGEMAVDDPVPGSFGGDATRHLGPWAGFITGWSYTFEMVIVCLADVTALAVYMGFWFPDVPRWIWVLATLAVLAAVNLVNVRVFGEVEFWFSLIKIIAIVAMILG